MQVYLEATCISNKGLIRKENEDNFYFNNQIFDIGEMATQVSFHKNY